MNVEIVKITEQKDGSAIFELEYEKDFIEFVKKYYNKKRCTTKMIQNIVIEGLENYFKKEIK